MKVIICRRTWRRLSWKTSDGYRCITDTVAIRYLTSAYLAADIYCLQQILDLSLLLYKKVILQSLL
jgi:hypothetical protein